MMVAKYSPLYSLAQKSDTGTVPMLFGYGTVNFSCENRTLAAMLETYRGAEHISAVPTLCVYKRGLKYSSVLK